MPAALAGPQASRGRNAWPVTASDGGSNDGCPSRPRLRARCPDSSTVASVRAWTGKSSGVMAALHTVLATNTRMYCKAPNSEDLQRSQLLGKTTPKLSTPVLRLRTEKFAVR